MSTNSSLSDQIQNLNKEEVMKIQLPSGETVNTGKNKPIESPSANNGQLEAFKKVPTLDLPEDDLNGSTEAK